MADAIIKDTNMAGTIGSKIVPYAQAVMRENAGLAALIKDVSQFAVKGVNEITFPHIGRFTVANRTQGSTNDAQALSTTSAKLALDKNAYLKWIIDGSSEIESTLNWKLECAGIAAADHAEFLDAQILATIAGAATVGGNFTESVKGLGKYEAFIKSRKAYIDNKFNLADAQALISTTMEAEILANPSLFANSVWGAPLIVEGEVKKLAGIPVKVKLSMTKDYYIFGKSTVVYGFQKDVAYAEQAELDYGTGAVKCVMDQKFGVGFLYKNGTTPTISDAIFTHGTITPAT